MKVETKKETEVVEQFIKEEDGYIISKRTKKGKNWSFISDLEHIIKMLANDYHSFINT